MKRRLSKTLLSVLLLLPVTALNAQQESPQRDSAMERIAPPEEARTRHCLPISHIRRIETVDDQTLLFHMRGGTKYVNYLPRSCHGLKRNSFVHQTPMNSYCDMDIITVVDMRVGMRMGSCALGKFEEVTGELELE